MGAFGATHGCWGGKKVHLPKIGHSYRTLMKLSTVTPYLNKIKK